MTGWLEKELLESAVTPAAARVQFENQVQHKVQKAKFKAAAVCRWCQ